MCCTAPSDLSCNSNNQKRVTCKLIRHFQHLTRNGASAVGQHCPKHTNAIIDENRNLKIQKRRCLGNFQCMSLITRTVAFFKRSRGKWRGTHFTCWNTGRFASRRPVRKIISNIGTSYVSNHLSNLNQTQRDRACVCLSALSDVASYVLAQNAQTTGHGRVSNQTVQAASISASIPMWYF